MSTIVSPSILNADFAFLGEECRSLAAAKSDWIHCDVMDGLFVPNISFGAPVVKCVDNVVDLPLDVHLMINEPIRYIDDFVAAGADIITFHVEATDRVAETIAAIHAKGVKAGLSLKPGTPVSAIEPYLADVEMVLVMSVEPGFGGQKFNPDAPRKIAEIRAKYDGLIEVDGGINAQTGKLCVEAGANVLVAGSYIMRADDRMTAVASLKNL